MKPKLDKSEPPSGVVFNTITSADWARSLAHHRKTPNAVSQQIKQPMAKIHDSKRKAGTQAALPLGEYPRKKKNLRPLKRQPWSLESMGQTSFEFE